MKKCGYCSRIHPDDAFACECGCLDPFGYVARRGDGFHLIPTAAHVIIGTYTQLVDISTWQDYPPSGGINFDTMAARVPGVFIKATQSTWNDQDFYTSWPEARGKLYRGAYHYFTWDASPIDQARTMVYTLGDDRGELPLVVDYECWVGVPEKRIASEKLWAFLSEIRDLTGQWPMIYTSPGYWLANGSPDRKFMLCDLWIAHYYVSEPLIPLPWSRWTFWQYTPKGDGFSYGVESAAIDLDWFNGTRAELDAYIGQQVMPPDVLFCVEALVDGQLVREDHRVGAREVGRLVRGRTYSVTDFFSPSSGAECWVRLADPDGWSAVVHGGRQFLRT